MIDTLFSFDAELNVTTHVVTPITKELEVTPIKEKQIIVPDDGVDGFNKVTINDIPGNYIEPVGTIEIVANGEYDITNYENAKVNVPKPTGTIDITTNGVHNISEYENANVNVGGLVINDAGYLFYQGARGDIVNELCSSISSKCTNFGNMFHYFNTLPAIPELNTSNGTNFRYMFYGCHKVPEFPMLNTSKGTDFDGMFGQCLAITEIPQIDTSNGTTFNSMFYNCNNLTTIPELDMSKADNVNGILTSSYKPTNLGGFKNLGKGFTRKNANNSNYKLDLSRCTELTYESLMNVINKLYDLNLTYNVANGGTLYAQQLVLGTTNLAKLEATEEGQQAIATAQAKGWAIS